MENKINAKVAHMFGSDSDLCGFLAYLKKRKVHFSASEKILRQEINKYRRLDGSVAVGGSSNEQR